MKPAGLILLMVLIGWTVIPSSGQTWLPTSAPVTDINGDIMVWDTIAISADGTKVLAGSQNGGYRLIPTAFYSSTNAGTTWNPVSAPATNGSVVMSADGSKWMIFSSPSYISTNDGAAWTSFSVPTGVAVASADLTILYSGSSSGPILVSTNSGATWAWTASSSDNWSSLACSSDGAKLFAVTVNSGFSGGIYGYSTNFGQTWNSASLDAPFGVNAVACSTNGNRVFLVGRSRVLMSTNSGATWMRLTSAPGHPYTAVGCSADGTRIAALSTATMPFVGNVACFSSDSGATWITNSVVNREWISVVNSMDGSRWFAGDWDGGLWTVGTNLSPVLKVKSKNLTLSWPVASTNFILQSSSNLVTWANVTNAPFLNPSNLQYEVTLPPTNHFYRLKTP